MQEQYIDSMENTTRPATTGYGMSDAVVNFNLDGAKEGIPEFDIDKEVVNSIASGTSTDGMDRPDFYKGMTYSKALDKGMTEEAALKMSGLSKETADRANQSFLGNFVDGVKADYSMLAFGIREYLLPEDKELQAERQLYVAQYDRDNEARKGMKADYDEDGTRNEPWNWGAGIGEMTLDVVAGYGAGAGAKTLGQSVARDMMFTTASEGMKYELHQDKIRLGMGIGVSALGNAAGGFIASLGKKSDVALTKSVKELEDSQYGLKLVQEMGKDDAFMKSYITGESNINEMLKGIHNPYTKDAYTKALKDSNVALSAKLHTMGEEIGMSPVELSKYRAGEISTRDMGEKAQKWIKEKKTDYRARENKFYNDAKLVDIDPDTGNFRTYEINDMSKELTEITRRSPEASAVVRNELAHIKKTTNEEFSDLAQETYGKLSKVNTEIDKLEPKVASAQRNLKVLTMREAEYAGSETVKESTLTKLSQDIALAGDFVKENTKKLKSLRGQRLGFSNSVNKRLDTANKLFPVGDDGAPLPTNLTANELTLLSRRISEKLNNAGGMLSMNDQNAISSLMDAQKTVKSFIKGNIKDPKFNEFNDKGNAIARERFALTGKDSRIQGVAKAMEDTNPEAMMRLFKEPQNGFANLLAFKDLTAKNDPEIYNQVASKVIYDKVFEGTSVASGIGEGATLNFKQLAKNMSAPDFIDNMKLVAPKEMTDFMRGMRYIVDTQAEAIEAGLKKVEDVESSLGSWFNPKHLAQNFFTEIHNSVVRAPMKLIDDVADTKIAIHTQDMPLIGEKMAFNKRTDVRSMLDQVERDLAAAKSAPERLLIGNKLENQMRVWTKQALDKTLGKQGGKMRPGHFGPLPEEAGINVGSHVTRLLDENPNMKLSGTQLTGWLKKQGVSPYEMNRLNIDGVDAVKSLDEWKGYLAKYNKNAHIVNSRTVEGNSKYDEYTYKKEGIEPGSGYEETALIRKTDGESFQVPSHTVAGVENNLGWRRQHVSTVNGEKGIMLNEIQSDVIQRSSKYPVDKGYDVKPTSEKKFQIGQIAAALDDSIKDGTNTVFIPIERSGDLAGNDAVTKKYMKLNDPKGPIQTLKKKLESQGYKLDVEKVVDGMQELDGQKLVEGLHRRQIFRLDKYDIDLVDLADHIEGVTPGVDIDAEASRIARELLVDFKGTEDALDAAAHDVVMGIQGLVGDAVEAINGAGKELWKLKVTPNSKVKKPRIDLLGIGAGGVGVAEAFRQNSERKDNGIR